MTEAERTIDELLDKVSDQLKEINGWVAEYRAGRREIERLKSELKSAQELNLELVSFLKQYEFLFDQNGHTRKELNALINKAE